MGKHNGDSEMFFARDGEEVPTLWENDGANAIVSKHELDAIDSRLWGMLVLGALIDDPSIAQRTIDHTHD